MASGARLLGNVDDGWQATDAVLRLFAPRVGRARRGYACFLENGLTHVLREAGLPSSVVAVALGVIPRALNDALALGEAVTRELGLHFRNEILPPSA